MFATIYDTTVCNSYVLRDIKFALEKARINGELTQLTPSSGKRVHGIAQVTPYSKSVPAFHHPIEISDGRDGKLIVVDQRPNLGVDREKKPKITQTTQYDFMTLRGALEYLWADGYQQSMLALGAVPIKVYSRWVSNAIRSRLGLDATDQIKLSALAGYYYHCQFTNKAELTEDEKVQIAVKLRNFAYVDMNFTLPLIENLPVLTDMGSFCEAVKETITNERLSKLNPGYLVTVTSGMWFGGNAREVVATALEYPPSLLAMIFTALNDRGMNSAQFTKLVDSASTGNLAASFNRGMMNLLEAVYDDSKSYSTEADDNV